MIRTIRAASLAILAGAAFPIGARAFELAGTKHVTAHTRDGRDIAIGTVTFTPEGGVIRYRLDMDMTSFKEFFLSMRPFKCLDGPDIWCYVPYPYDHPRTVAARDFGWLEHDLLFFWKTPTSYGAKLQNGLIYAFAPTGEALVGMPQAIDLDKIASPPDDPKTPPFEAGDRDDIPKGDRWIESLRIE